MAPSVAYEKDCEKKEAERVRDVKYDNHGKEQRYSNLEKDRNVEDRCCVKYMCSNGGVGGGSIGGVAGGSGIGGCITARSGGSGSGGGITVAKVRKSSKCSSSSSSNGSGGSASRRAFAAPMMPMTSTTGATATTYNSKGMSHAITSSKEPRAHHAAIARQEELCGRAGARRLTPTEVSAECYEVRRPTKKYQPCRDIRWQHGKYVRDDCGSGIVPVRFDIGPCKRLWCKTPLSMYQATIGELGKQLLCREKVITRDVWPEPPCNVAEYIMPPCRGYYRKYDCVRPCEEDYAYIKQGKKHYRDRVERYWEPCLTQEQKHTLNINEYGPHNAALTLKLRRETMGIPCW